MYVVPYRYGWKPCIRVFLVFGSLSLYRKGCGWLSNGLDWITASSFNCICLVG